jgi:hypothetical protein
VLHHKSLEAVGLHRTGRAKPLRDDWPRARDDESHEIGPWLDLRHIRGDDGTGCAGGEFVADTPNRGGLNYGTATFPKGSCVNGPNGDRVDNLRGVVIRRGGVSVGAGPTEKAVDLDALPFPGSGDYFEVVDLTGDPPQVDRHVLLETVRGCWRGEKAKRTFCGLNGESTPFRAWSPERAVEEIVHLVRSYRPRYVRTVDRMMAPCYYDAVLPCLTAADLGLVLCDEVRPALSREPNVPRCAFERRRDPPRPLQRGLRARLRARLHTRRALAPLQVRRSL